MDQHNQATTQQPQAIRKCGLATACRVCSIASFLFCVAEVFVMPTICSRFKNCEILLSPVGLALLTSISAIVCGHTALWRIKASNGRLGGAENLGGSLVIGYLCMAFALLIMMAIPNFATAKQKSQRNTCRANMLKIRKAVQQVLAKTNVTFNSSETSWGNVEELLVPTYIRRMPQCPSSPRAGMCYKVSNTSVECPNPDVDADLGIYHKL